MCGAEKVEIIIITQAQILYIFFVLFLFKFLFYLATQTDSSFKKKAVSTTENAFWQINGFIQLFFYQTGYMKSDTGRNGSS